MSSSFHVVNYQSQQTVNDTLNLLLNLFGSESGKQKIRRNAALLQMWAPANFNQWAPSVLYPNGASAMCDDGAYLWVVNKTYNSISVYENFNPPSAPVLVDILSGYKFSIPCGILYKSMHIYITNSGNNSVVIIVNNYMHPYSIAQTLFGNNYGFSQPSAIAADNANIWIANLGNNTITVIDSMYSPTIIPSTYISGPSSLAYDGFYMWVANTGNNTVTVFTTHNPITPTVVSDPTFSEPVSLAYDNNVSHNMWLVNAGNNSISVLSTTSPFSIVRTLSSPDYNFQGLKSVSYDSNGNMWVASTGNNSITVINTTTYVPTVLDYRLNYRGVDIAFDGTYAYVADQNVNYVSIIDKVSPYNFYPSFAVNLDVATYNFSSPSSLAFDGKNIWVVNGFGFTENPPNLPPDYTSNYISIIDSNTTLTVSNYLAYDEVLTYLKGITFDGLNMWVTNSNNKSVTIINVASQLIVNTLSGPPFNFIAPTDMAFDGVNMWITDISNNCVYIINAATQELVTIIAGTDFNFSEMYDITFDGVNMWVANSGNNSVTVIKSIYPYPLVANLTNTNFQFSTPGYISYDGVNMWVVNTRGLSGGVDSITIINAKTLAVVNVLSDSLYGFSTIAGIAFDGVNMWVVNYYENGTVTIINVDTKALVTILSDPSYGFYNPFDIVFDGEKMWITNTFGNSVTVIKV